MSLFLGKIHYWLFNKIQWFEDIEEEIYSWAEKQDLPVAEWKSEIFGLFGAPTEKKPLEDMIDTSNIHGWLQGKIESAELRQAALVTRIIGTNPGYKENLISIFEAKGKEAAIQYEGTVNIPEEAYNVMNDFILEGMPCDRVNEPVSSSENEFVWRTTMCLHTPHWDRVKGDVENFYNLREAWVKTFVNTLNPAFQYVRQSDGVNKIIRGES